MNDLNRVSSTIWQSNERTTMFHRATPAFIIYLFFVKAQVTEFTSTMVVAVPSFIWLPSVENGSVLSA